MSAGSVIDTRICNSISFSRGKLHRKRPRGKISVNILPYGPVHGQTGRRIDKRVDHKIKSSGIVNLVYRISAACCFPLQRSGMQIIL